MYSCENSTRSTKSRSGSRPQAEARSKSSRNRMGDMAIHAMTTLPLRDTPTRTPPPPRAPKALDDELACRRSGDFGGGANEEEDDDEEDEDEDEDEDVRVNEPP